MDNAAGNDRAKPVIAPAAAPRTPEQFARMPDTHPDNMATSTPNRTEETEDKMEESEDEVNDGSRSNSAEQSVGRGSRSGKVKKKKGQKFRCTGFGDCNLSFTRSEHLARHIRKHTGERPFMCHCGRFFSRLDNLRQHSSTVHADEPIPGDSLAATGARYQRHARSERTRGHSRSLSQTTNDGTPLEAPGAQITAGASIAPAPVITNAQSRPLPDPISLPQDIARQSDPAFHQYRSESPPDSPTSVASATFYRGAPTYRQRAAPYPPVSQSSSPIGTPGSRSNRNSRNFDTPMSTPNSSARNSMNLSTLNMNFSTPDSNIASRRLSMPQPPTPSLLDAGRNMTLPLPVSPTSSEYSTDSRRDSIGPLATDDRRKTWHLGSPSAYQSPLPRDILSPTLNSFARTSINGPGSAFEPPVAGMAQMRFHDRLPSISHILQESAVPTLPPPTESKRVSWASNATDSIDRRMSSDLGRTLHEGISPPTHRRIAPGQTRSGHGRSVSNIETKRWGVVMNQGSPLSNPPWEQRREQPPPATSSFASQEQRGFSQPPPANGTYNPAPNGNLTSPREHRQSFGSVSSSAVSEGIATPMTVETTGSQPRIFGEPGDAICHSETPPIQHSRQMDQYAYQFPPKEQARAPEPQQQHSQFGYRFPPLKEDAGRNWQMSGVEATGRPISTYGAVERRDYAHQRFEDARPKSMYAGSVSPLDALVTVAAGAARIS